MASTHLRALLAAAALALSSAAAACGYCVEDKIASVYDHALISGAVGRGHPVAFFHLDGPLGKDEATRRMLVQNAEATAGVDKGSVRLSLETLTISFAYDPARARLIAIQNQMDRKLAARKLSLFPLRVIERPAELKEISRR
jgi:hypothetical protein